MDKINLVSFINIYLGDEMSSWFIAHSFPIHLGKVYSYILTIFVFWIIGSVDFLKEWQNVHLYGLNCPRFYHLQYHINFNFKYIPWIIFK